MTVLVSTTRQWNPGDEFIFWGVKKLLNLEYCAIFDRNPDLNGINVTGNSLGKGSIDPFDYVVMAGTPEWFGGKLEPLFKEIQRTKKPVYFIGVGGNNFNLSELDKSVLVGAEIIIARDMDTKKMIERNIRREVHCLPCPSLFCVGRAPKVKSINKIGFVIQNPDSPHGHAVDESIFRLSLDLLNHLKDVYDVSVICHYFKELYLDIPGVNKVYSYMAEDYPNIYKKFDFIISTRLHGCLLSASLEIPTILINDNERCTSTIATVHSIKKCLSVDGVKSMLQNFNLENWYEDICMIKRNTLAEYSKYFATCKL